MSGVESVTVSEIVTIPLGNLLAYCDPMQDDAWDCGVITADDVEFCEDITVGRFPAGVTAEDSTSWEYNVARIAWLSRKGWKDASSDVEPVIVHDDLNPQRFTGSTSTVLVRIQDGNHRAAAAKVRGDACIQVVLTGSIKKARSILM